MVFKTAKLFQTHLITQRHIDREKAEIKMYICNCGKSYTQRQNMYRHRKVCSKGETANITDPCIIANERIKMLEKQIEDLILAQNHNTVNNNIGTQVNITINAFGKENIDYITQKQCLKIVNQVFNSVPAAAQIVFFNPDHPENHNIKIPNKKEPYAMIMKDDSTWEMTDRKKAIEKMTQKSYSVVESSFDKVHEQITPSKKANFLTFMDKMNDQEPGLWRKFQQELEMKIIGATR
jgi:hypothetical protein